MTGEVYDSLSQPAKLADKVWRHIVFGRRFDGMIASEIRRIYMIPIFGEDVINEIKDYYLNAKL